MVSVKDILSKTIQERKSQFKATDIDKVIIDGEVFTDYKAFSFIREKTYVKSPVRSSNGTIGNLNSYSTFTTPHLKIDFSLMSIESYRTLMNLIYEKNEFVVTCFDVVRNTLTTNKMYFTTEELPKLWTIGRAFNEDIWVELLGVEDYSVEMVGTNALLSEINILYYDKNNNILSSQIGVENVEMLVGENVDVPSIEGYNFDNAWERVGGKQYINNEAYRLTLNTQEEQDSRTIVFKAKYKDEQVHNLVLSYGLGTPLKDNQGRDILSIPFITGDTILQALERADISLWEGGKLLDLPKSKNPSIIETINGKQVASITHTRKGWYNSQSSQDRQPLTKNSELLVDGDMIIYEVFEPVKSIVYYRSNGGTTFDPLTVEYGVSVPLPIPYKTDNTFEGWYTDSNLTKKFQGTMPPYILNLYAKWVENK